ncbi:MAG: hypothetical protein ACOZBH_00290 [Patescibacteria group bacterium]
MNEVLAVFDGLFGENQQDASRFDPALGVLVKFRVDRSFMVDMESAGLGYFNFKEDEAKRQQARKVLAAQLGLDPYAHRDGVADVGMPAAQVKNGRVSAAVIVDQLLAAGLKLVSAGWFEKNRRVQKGPVEVTKTETWVQLTLMPAGDALELTGDQRGVLARLFHSTWGNLFVWNNANQGNPYTVNLTSQRPETEKPAAELRITNMRWEMAKL